MLRISNVFSFLILTTFILASSGLHERASAQPPDSGLSSIAAEWVKNNPPGRAMPTQPPSGNKKSPRPRMPSDEREAIGLPPPIWTARQKVHPGVYQALEEQKRLIQSNPAMAEFQAGKPYGFLGTTYVDIYLRHEQRDESSSQKNKEAIQTAQSKVLAGLTAAEFALFYRFENTAGLVGFVNEAGLDKLNANPDVVAVGVEEHRLVEDPSRVTHQPPPKHQPGEIIRPTPIERKDKVEVAVNDALMKSADGYVYVIVSLSPVPNEGGSYQAKMAARRQLQEKVLSNVTAFDFRLRGRSTSLRGYVNAAGLIKLVTQPDVVGVGLDGPPVKVPERPSKGGRRWTP